MWTMVFSASRAEPVNYIPLLLPHLTEENASRRVEVTSARLIQDWLGPEPMHLMFMLKVM